MSFLDAMKKKAKLTAASKLVVSARQNEGSRADQMYKSIYQDFADVITGDPMRAEALYTWGFALLHQAKTKSGVEAIKLYQEAITRFSFCLMIEPNYLGAAIDGGVACMDLARSKMASYNDELYDSAKMYFEKANAIQAGSASYNLACIYGLLGAKDECLKALETAKNRGSLPDATDILADPDMKTVKNQPWFVGFMDTLQKKPQPVVTPEPQPEQEPETQSASEEAPVQPVQDTVTPEQPATPKPVKEETDESVNEEVITENGPSIKIDESAFKGQHFKQ